MRYPFFLLAVLSFCSAGANAGDRGWYIGVGLGDVAANYKIADFDNRFVSEGLADDSDSAWKIFGGYEISGNFAIELGFADLHNDADERTTFSRISNGTGSRFVSLPGGAVSIDIDEISGYFISAIGSSPFTKRIDLNARAGAISRDARQTIVDLDQRTRTLSSTDTLVGLGPDYRFHNGVEIRGEVERYSNVGGTDQGIAALSVSYHF